MTKAVQAAKRGRGVSPIYLDEDDQPEQSNVNLRILDAVIGRDHVL